MFKNKYYELKGAEVLKRLRTTVIDIDAHGGAGGGRDF